MGHQPITGPLYRSPKALWKLIGSCEILDMTTIYASAMKYMRRNAWVARRCSHLRAVRVGRVFQNLEAFAPADEQSAVAVPNERNGEVDSGL
jgi:hypothetical protein